VLSVCVDFGSALPMIADCWEGVCTHNGVGLNTMNFDRQFTPFYNIIVAFTHDRQIREHSLEVCGKPKVGSVVNFKNLNGTVRKFQKLSSWFSAVFGRNRCPVNQTKIMFYAMYSSCFHSHDPQKHRQIRQLTIILSLYPSMMS